MIGETYNVGDKVTYHSDKGIVILDGLKGRDHVVLVKVEVKGNEYCYEIRKDEIHLKKAPRVAFCAVYNDGVLGRWWQGHQKHYSSKQIIHERLIGYLVKTEDQHDAKFHTTLPF